MYLPDVALADSLHEPVPALLDLDVREVVRVEPLLEAIDVAIGRCLVVRPCGAVK